LVATGNLNWDHRKIDMPPSSSGKSTLVSGNVTIAGHRTSLRLEPEMWDALKGVCARERLSIHEVCTRIDARRQDGTSLTSAVRTFMVKYYQGAATDEGHRRAGHGNGEPFGWAPVYDDRGTQEGDEAAADVLEFETGEV
jgi:predicted DNA-binding ribbon-helix-helix protein